MVDKRTQVHSHLGADKEPVWWDWWSENPAEVILVVFILVFFFLTPRAGCGITPDAEFQAVPEAEQGQALE